MSRGYVRVQLLAAEEKALRKTDRKLVRDIAEAFQLPENEYLENYKVSKGMIMYLCDELAADLAPRSSEGYPVLLKVLSSLKILLDGHYQRGNGNEGNQCIAQTTVSKYLNQFVAAVNARFGLYYFEMYYEAFLAGTWASVGSTFGKLSGTTSVVGDSYVIWAALLGLMVLVNTWGCRLYLRSLDAASNSVAPTVVSAASSYVLSGAIGIAVFEEGASMFWWAGATLIVFGLSLVARPRTPTKPKQAE